MYLLEMVLKDDIVALYTVWTKMRSLAGSLADGVLADAILIPPNPPILPTNIRKVRGRQKGSETKDACQRLMLNPYITASRTSSSNFSGKVPAKGVFSIMHSYFETLGKYLLFTIYLTSTNIPTAQQKKGHNLVPLKLQLVLV